MSGKATGSRVCSGNRLVASLVWDICYPLKHDFMGWSVMLFPGDHYIVPKDKM